MAYNMQSVYTLGFSMRVCLNVSIKFRLDYTNGWLESPSRYMLDESDLNFYDDAIAIVDAIYYGAFIHMHKREHIASFVRDCLLVHTHIYMCMFLMRCGNSPFFCCQWHKDWLHFCIIRYKRFAWHLPSMMPYALSWIRKHAFI